VASTVQIFSAFIVVFVRFVCSLTGLLRCPLSAVLPTTAPCANNGQ